MTEAFATNLLGEAVLEHQPPVDPSAAGEAQIRLKSSDGRYLLPSFIYQTHGLLASVPVGLAMARVGAQRRPEPVSLKINGVICSLRRSFLKSALARTFECKHLFATGRGYLLSDTSMDVNKQAALDNVQTNKQTAARMGPLVVDLREASC